MSNKSLEKGKHLKIEDRLIIEYWLAENYSLKEIAERIKKSSRRLYEDVDFFQPLW